MKKIKIVIVGLGGVGGYYGGMLAKKYENHPEIEIYFIARGANLKKIQESGLKLITEKEEYQVYPKMATDNVSEIGIADYVIITTKSYDLSATIEQIRTCLNENTVILPLLNGVDISDRIRATVPETEVWDGCCYIVGRLNEPGIVESSGGIHDLFFGYENHPSEKLIRMEKIMKDAEIPAVYSENIRMIIWRKFIFISTTASLTSYFNVGFRDLLTEENRRKTTIEFMNEVASVAKAEGITFEKDIIQTTIRHIEKLPFGTTSSMHSDFQTGHKTELNTLTEIVIELGKKHGVPTPVYEKVYKALKSRLEI